MKNMFFCLIQLFGFLTSVSLADWNSKAQSLVPSYRHPFPNAFEATIWRAVNAPILFPDAFSNYREVKIQNLRAGTFMLQKENALIKAPIMVVLPGIFSSHVSFEALRSAVRFNRLGYHVLILPNPWSRIWMKDRPEAPPGDLYSEANAISSMISEFVNANRQVIDRVNLIGMSYGAFLSAMVAAKNPDISGQTTLISPPFDIGWTLKELDFLADRSQSQIDPISDIFSKALLFMGKRSPQQLVGWNPEREEGICVYGGFFEELASSIFTYTDLHHLKIQTPEHLAKRDFQRFTRSFRFRTYLREYFPDFDRVIHSGDGALLTWTERIRNRSRTIQIITTEDDFLNEPNAWRQLRASENLIVLPHGGHLGFLGLPWFESLLSAQYGPIE